MHLGGPMEDDDGGIVGTIFIINAADRAAALTFTKEEPFHKAGVFEAFILRRWRQMQPEVIAGANASSATEGSNQLKEEGQD